MLGYLRLLSSESEEQVNSRQAIGRYPIVVRTRMKICASYLSFRIQVTCPLMHRDVSRAIDSKSVR